LTNFSANKTVLASCIVFVFLSGCASAPIKATEPRELPPPLEIRQPSPDKASPQAAETATVRWKAEAAGGEGKRVYTFWSFNGQVEVAEQKGPSPVWDWKPAEPGTYRMKVAVRDSVGNTAESGWSPEYVVAPQLVISSFFPDKASPQAAETATVRWKAEAAGGVGGHEFEFRIHDGKGEKVVQAGPSPAWDWKPTEPGAYRVSVAVRDSIGNTVEIGRALGYRIVPKLGLSSFSPDKASPQAAEMATVRWKAEAAGGVGGHEFEFRIHDGKGEKVAQAGPSPAWDWKPAEPGTYRMKVAVRDSIGNAVESRWSPEYVVAPRLVVSSLSPDKASPQAAETTTVRWMAGADGGIGERSFEFRIFDGKEEKTAQRGPSGLWDWKPAEPGTYRMRVAVRDSIGNTVESDWFPEYVVVPRLAVSSLSPDKVSPQAAEMATVRWKADAVGGVGARAFEFRIHDGKGEKAVQTGPSPAWDWKPAEAGFYKVKVAVRDSVGNAAEGRWSPEYAVALPLAVSLLSPDKASPQAAETATVRWKVEAAGGVGAHTFEFRVHDGKGEKAAQTGPSPAWDWKPAEPGTYRVKVAVRDSIGNAVESRWSQEYAVAPKLAVSSLSPDIPSPQPASVSSIRWTAGAEGGVGDRAYAFWKTDGKEERMVQSGPSAYWEWSPRKAESYRVKVVVRDSIGNTADSGWSPVNEVGNPMDTQSLIAVMPLENLAGTALPLKKMGKSVRAALKSRDLNLLEEDALEKFMERHRVRYAGGITEELGKEFQKETGAKAALFLSFELYDDADPPKIALAARLVSAGQKTVILWADGVAMAGNDSPGVLGLGRIHDPRVLWDKARTRIVNSLAGYLAGKETVKPGGAEGKYRPKSYYKGSPEPADGGEAPRIAILPFLNESTRRNAGEIMAIHFLRRLSERENLKVIEPGEVRQALLMSRTIMERGLSLPQAEVLHALLGADLVLMGIVTDYEDYKGLWGKPKVNFSVRLLDMKTKRVTWSSISHNLGDDGMFFFDMGKVNTAHALASSMVRSAVEMMLP
jgi:hypothetical protein